MRIYLHLFAFSLLVLYPLANLCAQPRIDRIQNNYSYLLPGNPNYGIAQGSIFIITGTGLATTSTDLQSAPLQETLNGVSARVSVGGSSTNVIWYYVTPNQVAGILPSATPVGEGTLTITNSAGTSTPAPIRVVQSAFGTLTLDGSGTGGAAVYDANYKFLSASNSAKPGDVILLFGTGVGPVVGDEAVAQTQSNLTALPVTVEIGGVAGNVLYRGRTIYPGLDQINVTIPSGIPYGCNVSLVVKTGSYVSNNTTIPVSASGGSCPAPEPSGGDITISQAEISTWLVAGEFRSGAIGLTRQTSYSITDNPQGGQPTTSINRSDVLSASFNRISGPDLQRLLTAQTGGPVAGACDVYTGTIVNPYPNLTYTSLDAGAFLTVSGGAGNRSAERSRNSVGQIVYSATIGTGAAGNYLDAGRYTLTGPGGADVGSFTGSIQVGPELEWTNRTSLTSVDRSRPLTVTWTGGEPSTLVTIQGTSTVIQGTSVSATSFQCYARNTDRQFTVPVSVLSQLPASGRITAGTISLLQRGTLAIASVGTGTRLRATGIDYLTAGNQWGVAQSAEYK